ncbi:hypothetical protein NQ314_015921 [Rhamnusium bicolor]|uniref:Uncharacterized protein n=1 Tax=Rhamnusium bicolor TaxID=1586634 RepID=A0AAV8WXI0_9CUCU|nr:hypothetical protein NQ314_015921 [Rhamnusium bicolor]
MDEELRKEVQELCKIVAQLQVHNPHTETNTVTISIAVPAPEKFSFIKEEWPTWKNHYQIFRKATKRNELPQSLQINNNVVLHIGPDIDRLLISITLQRTQESFQSYNEAEYLFTDYFDKLTNIIYNRAKFNLRNQHVIEFCEEYIANVMALAKSCKFEQLNDELIRDRLVVDVRDKILSEKLQLQENLNLETAIQKIVQAETIKNQNDEAQAAKFIKNIDRQSCEVVNYKFSKSNHKLDEGYRPGSCKCSKHFQPKPSSDHNICSCDCNEENLDCIQLKKGKEHISMTDRICISNNECGTPVCEHGAYVVKEGKCPSKKEKIEEFRRMRINY